MSTEAFATHARDAVREFGRAKPTDAELDDFDASPQLRRRGSRRPVGARGRASRPPSSSSAGTPGASTTWRCRRGAFTTVIEMLGATGLNADAKVICEKPFGHDLASAKALNATIAAHFDESQVFRIDHFLGKESVDNIIALRFANGLFEPIWNRDHVSYVQIDVPESISIEGRAAFYETCGAYRDMVVTHLFQLMGIVAMEPPTSLDAQPLRDETVKVFESMPSIDPQAVVRGQYDGYRKEPGVDPESQTETFVALRTEVDNWRWKGVPFYLRTGKCLEQARQVVTIGLREPTMRIFPHDPELPMPGYRIVIDFADPGSIHVDFLAKLPGPAHAARQGAHDVRLRELVPRRAQPRGLRAPDPRGDARQPGAVHAVRRHRAAVGDLRRRCSRRRRSVEPYWRASWGPESIARLVAPHRWYLPE